MIIEFLDILFFIHINLMVAFVNCADPEFQKTGAPEVRYTKELNSML